MGKYLDILEVSQKQAFIFASNHLKDNVSNSALIARITSAEYFEEITAGSDLYRTDENIVYAGGGHTVLVFSERETAKKFNSLVTKKIHEDYPEILMFAKIEEYDDSITPGENLENLVGALERKKALRESVFHQGTFGIEAIDTNTLRPIRVEKKEKDDLKDIETDHYVTPLGFTQVSRFSELGGSKDESNFIAVVHIDGNGMGARVKQFYDANNKLPWEEFKTTIRKFSEGIDKDFKASLKEMNEKVAGALLNKKLDQLKLKENNFPVRRLISSGDDICFVTEGRIGIECAVAFIEALNKKTNEADKKGYSACAGVAIVHQKFPFYRAYEIAEALCSNAKKYGASISPNDNGSCVSAIDWHIEFGELKDSLDEVRSEYKTADKKYLQLRPYIINAPEVIRQIDENREYNKFSKLLRQLLNQDDPYASGKLKQMRSVLKKGEIETIYYMKFNKIYDLAMSSYQGIYKELDYSKIGTGEWLERRVFVKTADGKERSVLFDAVELIDNFLFLE